MTFALSDIRLSSNDIAQGASIADAHSKDGGNVAPDLQWQNLPAGTRSVAVFCHDPDAPLITPAGNYGFVHWLIYNIPPQARGLPQGCTDYAQGLNDFRELGYGGPRPPAGHGRHHYYFWVLALDLDPTLENGLELAAFLAKVEPHVLGMNRLVGYYQVD